MNTFITRSKLYERQIKLLGKEAQTIIEGARVLVVGVGGLGCPALQYLASAGVGEIGLQDFDKVSISNLQRQILFQMTDIGREKVEVARERLLELAPFCKINTFDYPITSDNADSVISNYDIILDCTDNFSTKFLIHDVCLTFNKLLVQAAVYQYEGQILTFDFRDQKGPCLRCLWPEEPQDGRTGTCADVGVLGPLLGVMGSLQAAEVIKLLSGREHLKNGEVLFVDLQNLGMETRRFKQNPECPWCIKRNFKLTPNIQISLPANIEEFVIIDVRSEEEFKSCSFIRSLRPDQKRINVPLEIVETFFPESDLMYLMVCTKGARSQKACQSLLKKHDKVFSLIGGVEALLLPEEVIY